MKIHQEYEELPGAVSVRSKRGEVRSSRGGRGAGRLAALRNTWWVRVQEDRGERRVLAEMNNETNQYVKHTPLYHRYRNKTQNSLWENHCGLH